MINDYLLFDSFSVCWSKILNKSIVMDSVSEFKQKCQDNKLFPVGFIGCGNMAMSIVSGLVKSHLFQGQDVLISGNFICGLIWVVVFTDVYTLQ